MIPDTKESCHKRRTQVVAKTAVMHHQSFGEVFDTQLAGLAVRGRVACAEGDSNEGDEVSGHFVKHVRI
jgi:hypothetical protein